MEGEGKVNGCIVGQTTCDDRFLFVWMSNIDGRVREADTVHDIFL
jgi:hypothetical protein